MLVLLGLAQSLTLTVYLTGYANSLLATLNTRRALRGKGTDTEDYSHDSSDDMAITHTSLQIVGVTPSMLSRSRGHRTQVCLVYLVLKFWSELLLILSTKNERVSLPFTGTTSRMTTSDGKSTGYSETNEETELKDLVREVSVVLAGARARARASLIHVFLQTVF